MKAWVLHGVGNIKLEEVPKPALSGGDALVKVKCASVCSSDLSRVFSNGAYYYPIIIGHEFSGIVEECENSAWVGQRVSVFPLLPCFECESCKQKHYETCSRYSYIGSRRDGGFAEYVAVPIWNLFPIYDKVSYEQAALFEPTAVALHAVKMLCADNHTNVAVVGTGAIGLLIARWLEILHNLEATVLGRNSIDDGSFSACFEAVGSADSVKRSIEITRPNGQLILIGNPAENFNLERQMYWKILRKQLTVRGSWNSSYQADWQDVVENIDNLRLDELISHRYAFDELDKALEMMHSGKEKRGKIVISE